jgi:integrase
MAKITKRLVDTLRPDPGRDVFAWDDSLKGFAVRMTPAGSASYLVQYRTPHGQTRRYAFAKVGTLTPDQARTKARQLLADAESGGDPSAQRHEAREALTIEQLCAAYLEAARAGLVLTRFRKPKRPSTIMNDESRVSRHIVPLIGRLVARDLNRAAVQRMVDAIAAGKTARPVKTKTRGKAVVRGGAVAAARTAELLGGIFTWGERRGLVAENPVRGIEKYRGEPRDRLLSASDLAALGAVSRERADQPAVRALKLLALTGARREEICGLKWSAIDWNARSLNLHETKTGRSIRPIGRAALRLLESMPDTTGSDWVFPNSTGTGSADLKKALARLFDAAALPDARSHVLRRTFASVAANEGYGDATIGELLGHARRGVTERHYVRRSDPVLLAAADKVAERIAAMLDGKSGDVLSFVREDSR